MRIKRSSQYERSKICYNRELRRTLILTLLIAMVQCGVPVTQLVPVYSGNDFPSDKALGSSTSADNRITTLSDRLTTGPDDRVYAIAYSSETTLSINNVHVFNRDATLRATMRRSKCTFGLVTKPDLKLYAPPSCNSGESASMLAKR